MFRLKSVLAVCPLHAVCQESFAFVHMDSDLYDSVYDSLEKARQVTGFTGLGFLYTWCGRQTSGPRLYPENPKALTDLDPESATPKP